MSLDPSTNTQPPVAPPTRLMSVEDVQECVGNSCGRRKAIAIMRRIGICEWYNGEPFIHPRAFDTYYQPKPRRGRPSGGSPHRAAKKKSESDTTTPQQVQDYCAEVLAKRKAARQKSKPSRRKAKGTTSRRSAAA